MEMASGNVPLALEGEEGSVRDGESEGEKGEGLLFVVSCEDEGVEDRELTLYNMEIIQWMETKTLPYRERLERMWINGVGY